MDLYRRQRSAGDRSQFAVDRPYVDRPGEGALPRWGGGRFPGGEEVGSPVGSPGGLAARRPLPAGRTPTQAKTTPRPLLDTAAYYFVGSEVTADPGHALGSMLGDLLVQFPSAAGQGRRRHIPFELDKGRHVGGLHHFQILKPPCRVPADLHLAVRGRPAADVGPGYRRTAATSLVPVPPPPGQPRRARGGRTNQRSDRRP